MSPALTPNGSISALKLRNIIEQLLADHQNKLGGNILGVYRYESGLVEPAIAIGNPPNDVDVEGLECQLPLFPDTRNEWTTVAVHSQEMWDIILVQRNGREDEDGNSLPPTLPAAVDRLRRFFVVSEGVYTPQDDILGSYPQYRLTFQISDLHPIINYRI